MTNLGQAVWVELLKARRSRVPLITLLAFALAPLAGGFFMVVKDPTTARRLGMISAKAQLVAGSADWPTYFTLLAQAVAIAGVMLFGFVASWVFGREYSDHTLKDLLALPTPRSSIVLAKFVVVALWCLGLVAAIYALGLLVGLLVGLPPAPAQVMLSGSLTVLVTALLTLLLAGPVAFFAGLGRGYLAPLGAVVLLVVAAQVIAAAGWGEYFPWSIPALYAGVAGPGYAALGPVSYALVGLTGLAGIAATLAWWVFADQAQ